jgi:hypothetical protein
MRGKPLKWVLVCVGLALCLMPGMPGQGTPGTPGAPIQAVAEPMRLAGQPGQPTGGWRTLAMMGEPQFSEDTGVRHRTDTSVQVVARPGAAGAVYKEFAVTGGRNYVADVWVQAEGLKEKQSSFKTVVHARAGGQDIAQGEGPTVFESPEQRRDTGFTRLRSYFTAPAGADSVRVEFTFAGPGKVWLAEAVLAPRMRWQDAIGKYSSAGVAHPIGANLTKMFASWQWDPIAKESDTAIRNKIAPLMKMSESELTAKAQAEAAKRAYLDNHSDMESMARRLAVTYGKTKDESYARKAILIMLQMAQGYPNVPKLIENNDLFHSHGKYIPMECLYAYDLIYNSPEWDRLSQELGIHARDVVEGWFRQAVMNLYNLCNDEYYSNIVPYGLRNAFGAAVVLNDPDLLRLFFPWADTMFSGRQFHADGMWQEGTPSYNNQVAANALLAFRLLKETYRDPEGYADPKYGYLDHLDLAARYPILAKSDKIDTIMQFPDGAPVALHDTWPKDPAKKSAKDPILRNKLKNIELWHFGHFALTQGDTKNATQVHLTFPPLSEGLPYGAGHYHGNHLGMILWGAGMEMLPDAGYPKGPNRYFNMDTVSHNTPWVWSQEATPYKSSFSRFTRPALLAYDPGDLSGKQVQLVEASEPGPPGDAADIKRRLLMVVQLDGNRSYVLDLSRLKGGQAHELFMRSSEDEDTAMTASLPLTKLEGTVQEYMKSIGREQGLPDYRDWMKRPETGDGSRDFDFVWQGVKSGSQIRAFMNGVPGGEVIFSQIPTNRRTYNEAKTANDFPGWHLYRRHIVDPGEVTRYGAVYETWRKEERPLVETVTWVNPEGADPLTIAALVETADFKDTIYISDDTQERTIHGMKLAGRVAVVRTLKPGGRVEWGYLYGQGSIQAGTFHMTGVPDQRMKVSAAQGSAPSHPANELRIDAKLPPGDVLAGLWLTVRFSDRSGYGMRIERVGDRGDTIVVPDPPGFEITPQGAKMLFFPRLQDPVNGSLDLHRSDAMYYEQRIIPGDVRAELQQPSFQLYP